MSWAINRNGKRILAVCCVVLITLLQIVFVVPVMHGEAAGKAGEELEVRVQYEGEAGGKIRTMKVFTNSDLEELGTHRQMFTNVTRVGTLMRSATLCIELKKIIEAAGIDLASVESFTFRTTDGYTMTFYGEDYLGSTGWYYPNLGERSYRVDSEDGGDGALQMEPGALDEGVREAGAVLALKSFSTKSPSASVTYDKMTTNNSYRFFTGQTNLSYLRYEDEDGNEVFHPTTEDDITAWDSVKYIYGVDVVLKGAPPLKGIGLDVLGDDIKVGSQVQVQVTFEGDTMDLFSSSDVTWSSSDDSIATVDENGVVTIRKEGEVTITAEAAGKTASVTISVEADKTDDESDQDKNDNTDNSEDNKDTQKTANKDKVTATTKATKPDPEASTTITKPDVNKKADKKADKKEDQNPENHDGKDKEKTIIMAREISIGKEIKPDPEEARASFSVKSDAQALEEAESYNKNIVTGAAAAAVFACAGGAVFRIRRFRIDMGANVKGKH